MAKTQIDETAIGNELDRVALMVQQVYKTIRDYRANTYPSFPFNPATSVYPLIVTLEENYWFGHFVEMLEQRVKALFTRAKLPESWLQEMPYSICSMEELERMIQIMGRVGIADFMRRKVCDVERRQWKFDSFMRESFGAELDLTTFLLQRDLDDLLPQSVRDRRREQSRPQRKE